MRLVIVKRKAVAEMLAFLIEFKFSKPLFLKPYSIEKFGSLGVVCII